MNSSINPFVDESTLPKLGSQNAMAGVNRLPAVPRSPSSNTTTNRTFTNPRPSLPSIPSSPRVAGTIPSIQKPAALPTPAPAEPAQTNEVQGVITGNDGQNMAIMSDGTVVSEGESYNDGRIAYIGGDGIQFEDGSTMNYK